MPWDNEIWAPCRLGEKFEYTDLGNRRNGWLLSVSADWMGGRGNHCAVNRQEDLLMPHGGYNIKIGLGPRPWSKCWTFEPKIMIVPPYWIWDFSGFDADKLGIDLHKRDGAPRKIRLQSVGISYGRAIYQMQIIGGGLPIYAAMKRSGYAPSLDDLQRIVRVLQYGGKLEKIERLEPGRLAQVWRYLKRTARRELDRQHKKVHRTVFADTHQKRRGGAAAAERTAAKAVCRAGGAGPCGEASARHCSEGAADGLFHADRGNDIQEDGDAEKRAQRHCGARRGCNKQAPSRPTMLTGTPSQSVTLPHL